MAGRTIAIEVELTAKTEERWQEILAERATHYDQVWYFTRRSCIVTWDGR